LIGGIDRQALIGGMIDGNDAVRSAFIRLMASSRFSTSGQRRRSQR
jgi:hypothetical protein